jgi:hypothetical protein
VNLHQKLVEEAPPKRLSLLDLAVIAMSKLPIADDWAARVMQKQGRRNAVCGEPVDIKVWQ